MSFSASKSTASPATRGKFTPTAARFVLDLRAPPPPPPPPPRETEPERCERLEQEVKVLKESQKALLAQVGSLTRQLQAAIASPPAKTAASQGSAQARRTNNVRSSSENETPVSNGVVEELEKAKSQLKKLQEEHKIALELIVALGATFAHVPAPPPVSGPSSTETKKGSEASTPVKSAKTSDTRPPFVASSDKGDTFNAYAVSGGKKKSSPHTSRRVSETPS